MHLWKCKYIDIEQEYTRMHIYIVYWCVVWWMEVFIWNWNGSQNHRIEKSFEIEPQLILDDFCLNQNSIKFEDQTLGFGAQMLNVWYIYLSAPWNWPSVRKYAIHWVSGVVFGFLGVISFIPGFIWSATENLSITDFFVGRILLLGRNEVICVWLFGLHITAKAFGGRRLGFEGVDRWSHCRSSFRWFDQQDTTRVLDAIQFKH